MAVSRVLTDKKDTVRISDDTSLNHALMRLSSILVEIANSQCIDQEGYIQERHEAIDVSEPANQNKEREKVA